MSILGRLFGTEAAITESIHAVRDGLDALVYTDEERSVDAAKERAEARSMVIGWMQATQGQNLSRRVLALGLATIWASQYIGAMALSVASIWATDPDNMIKAARLLTDGVEQMDGAMMLILSFYFAAPYMGNIVETAMNKFGKKQEQ